MATNEAEKATTLDGNAVRTSYPIQSRSYGHPSKSASVNHHVYLAAYEVYSAVYGPQQALLDGWCRGGFATSELVAFLYARAFPRQEWTARVEEAMNGMDIA